MMLREELILTAIVEDCFPARNFLGLFGLKEPWKTFNNMSRLKFLDCVCHHCKISEALLECMLFFFTKAKSLEHFFPPMTRFSLSDLLSDFIFL